MLITHLRIGRTARVVNLWNDQSKNPWPDDLLRKHFWFPRFVIEYALHSISFRHSSSHSNWPLDTLITFRSSPPKSMFEEVTKSMHLALAACSRLTIKVSLLIIFFSETGLSLCLDSNELCWILMFILTYFLWTSHLHLQTLNIYWCGGQSFWLKSK